MGARLRPDQGTNGRRSRASGLQQCRLVVFLKHVFSAPRNASRARGFEPFSGSSHLFILLLRSWSGLLRRILRGKAVRLAQELGALLRSPYDKDPSIVVSIWVPPTSGNPISGKPKGRGSYMRTLVGAILCSRYINSYVHPRYGPIIHNIGCGPYSAWSVMNT